MTTKYEMWMTYNSEAEKIQFPVLPETFSVKNGSNNDSVDITGLGEIVIMQSRPAVQISFSSFFPATRFPGIQVSTITKPLTLVQKICEWKAGDKPVHFLLTACGVDLHMTIESFNYDEVGGDPGSYHYDITLKEYREITTRQVKVDIGNSSATVDKSDARVDNTVTPKTYTVKSGDCLWNIAKMLYGSGASYTKIYNANKGIIGGNPNLIYSGQVLTIP